MSNAAFLLALSLVIIATTLGSLIEPACQPQEATTCGRFTP